MRSPVDFCEHSRHEELNMRIKLALVDAAIASSLERIRLEIKIENSIVRLFFSFSAAENWRGMRQYTIQ